jgi:broad specificity phosphatase PhoE
MRSDPTDALVLSSGHFLRVLAARWIGLSCDLQSPDLQLDTASLSLLATTVP